MPVTINPASHPARAFPKIHSANSQFDLLRVACPKECSKDTEILISSFQTLKQEDNIVASSGSFLRGAIQAWAHHLHLMIRPEDIWFAILVQLNFYMDANAEKLRHLFVDHKGKEEIKLETPNMNAESLKELLGSFSTAIQKRIKTEWMFDWIMPDFSTTTADDKMTANVLMMGLMQSYFSYYACESCGIPSITLLGDREDWVKLLKKLDRLPEFGDEPTEFATGLRPILTRFVRTFDVPHSDEIRAFWNRIVRCDPQNDSGAPPYRVSGWLMGFCHWSARGEPKFNQHWRKMAPDRMELDGVVYPILDITDIPVGYAKAPVRVRDWPGHAGTKYATSKESFPGAVVAGALGKRISRGAPKMYSVALQQSVRETTAATATAVSKATTPAKDIDTNRATTVVEGGDSASGASCLSCFCFTFPESWRRKPKVINSLSEERKADSPQEIPLMTVPMSGDVLSSVSKSEVVPLDEQGTLQPVSGWIFFGPEVKSSYYGDNELDQLESYLMEDSQWRWNQTKESKK